MEITLSTTDFSALEAGRLRLVQAVSALQKVKANRQMIWSSADLIWP